MTCSSVPAITGLRICCACRLLWKLSRKSANYRTVMKIFMPLSVAIGETGLDYYRNKGEMGWQQERFRNHIRAAKQSGKPLIIHSREASVDTIRIMRDEGAAEPGGVMHCFTESREVARQALDLNFYI